MMVRIAMIMASVTLAFAPLAVSQTPVSSPSVASLVDQAAAAMKQGQFDRALELYSQARTALPNNAEIPYNMGVAAYRQGDFEKAAEHLKDAIGLTNDAKLRQNGIFNLGNAAYSQSLKAMQGQADPAQARQQLSDASTHVKEALQQFKQAMDADPDDDDARVNAELSHRLLKQLEQMQEQMQQPQQDQNQDQQNQDQQNQDQQNEDQQSQGQQQQDPQQQPQQDQQKPNENQEQDQAQQEEQQQQQGQSSEQPTTQPEPKPNEAIEAQPQDRPQTQPEDQGDKPATSQPQPRKQMTREAAERMLQMVRDKERKRRQELARREAMKYAPAERDW
jgi:Ca-activated chloride channel homolog